MRITIQPLSRARFSAILVSIFFVTAGVILGTFLHTKTATAAVNSTLNFQARLMAANGSVVPDGDYNVEFKLFNAASSSGSSQGSCTGDAACLWTETRTTTNRVRVANGYLTVNLGSVTAFPAINWDQELWLTMNIGTTAVSPTWDGEMTPRLKLTAVPYAFRAGQLVTTNGSFTSNLSFIQPTANRSIQVPDESGTICLQNSVNCGFLTGTTADYIQNQNSVNQTANFRISGTGRANTALMTPILQPTVDGTTALKVQSTDAAVTAMTIDTYNGRIAIGADTAAQERLDVIGNLQVRDAATATKSYRLRTNGGGLDFEGAGASLVLSMWSGAGYAGTQYNQITFKSDGSAMDFARGFNLSDAAARVGLAGNVNPQYSLDVNGDINTSTQYRIGGTVICTATGCTPAAGSTNYIQNQNSSDQTANFRISGTGRANTALQAPLFDTATATTLNIGTTNATGINLNKATTITGALTQSGGAISLTGNAASSITTSSGTLALQSGGNLTLTTTSTNTINLTTGSAGVVVKPTTDNAAAFQVQNASNASIFNIDTSAGRITQTVGLRLSVGAATDDTFTTPAGSNVGTAINIPLYNPGASGQLLALGLPSTADATARAISVFDARTSGTIQPAIGVFSPNENDIFGLSWNGLNTTASLETLSAAIALRPGGTNVKLWAGSTGVAIGSNVSSASYPLDVTGDVNTSTQYRIGGTVICTATGCTAASGSSDYIQNQNSSDQTANFRISGTGRANTALQAPLFDTATAVALGIGTTNATAINLNKSTTITGGITQSGGAISLTGNAASSITTSTGALTLTAAGTSNWTVGGTNQSLTITTSGSGVLTLGTTGAGTVTMGSSSSIINIGTTNNAHTVHIADGGTSTTQSVIMGSTNGASAVTVQGGTGAAAIALTTAANGKISINAQGTGGVTGLIGSSGFSMKTTTDSSMAFAIQASNNDYIFSVSTSGGLITMGAIQASYSGFSGTLDTPLGDLTIGSTNNDLTLKGSSAMTLQATSGSFTSTIGFTAPTANRSITFADEAGTVCLRNSTNCGFAAATGSANYIQNTTTLQSANFAVQAATSGSVAGVLQANAAGTGDILQLKNGAGTAVASFGYNGAILFKNSTNSVTAFDIQNAAGASVLTVDTTNKRVGIGNNTPTVDLDVGPGTLSVGQIVQIRIGDFLLQSQQGGANGLAALTSRGSNGNLTIDGASGSAVYLAPFTTNNVYLASGGGKVAVGGNTPALKFEVQGGDAAVYNSGNNARVVLGDSSVSGQYGYLQWDSANDYFRIEKNGTNGVKINDNYVTIGNVFPSKPLIVANGTNALFEVGATGQLQARTSTDSTTAFQMQNSLGDVYFNGDSTSMRVGIGDGMIAPEVTLDVRGVIQQTGLETPGTGAADNNKWTKLGYCTITAQYDQCLTTINIIGGHDGSTGNNTQGTVSVRIKQQNALGGAPYVNVTLNDTAEVITKSDIVAVTTVNTGATTTVELYGRITNTFENWFYTPVMNTGGYGESTWNWSPFSPFIAALPGGTQTPARYGNMNANQFAIESTNANAMVIQNAGGVNKLFVADTTTLRIAIGQATAAYTLDVAGDINTTTQLRIAGTSICDTTGCTAKTGSGFYIHNQTTVQASNFWVQAATTGTVAGIIQAFNGGAGDILQLKNGAGTNVAVFGSTGAISLQNSTNSTAAFQVSASAGAGGNSILRVDSTNERVAIGVISDPIGAKLSIATASTVSLRAYQSSTFDVLQLANATSDVFNVSNIGAVNVKTTTNSATAFRVQNNLGTQVFSVDSIDNILMLGTGFGGKHIAMDIETNPYIEVVDSTGTNGVGLAQVESGNAYLNHDSDLVIQRTTNSATDLQVLNSSDVAQFTVDTTNSQIEIGTSDTTGTILVLDTKTGSGDPTGINGAMYYNSNSGKFRCYQNSAWLNCLNGDAESVSTVPGPAATTMTKGAAATIFVTPIYVPGRMTVNELRVNVVTTVLGAAGDIGLYNSAGQLVINGGSSSVSTAVGLKTVTPTQAAGAARTIEAGQYYIAVTWNSTTGSVSGAAQVGNLMKRNGTLSTGGGLVLPSSITLSSITAAANIPAMSIAN